MLTDFNPPAEATRKQVEGAITAWRAIREERMVAEKVADEIKKREMELKRWIMAVLHEQAIEGIVINDRLTGLTEKEVPEVMDKVSFLEYIRTTGELDLLQFRPAVGAIKDRVDNGVTVPGIGLTKVYDLTDRKA